MLREPVSVLTSLLILCSSGCFSGPSADGGPIVSDSAGVQIVLNKTAVWESGEEWTVSDVPLIQIGVREGDPAYQFVKVWEAKRLPDGRYIAGDDAARELRVFDSDGQHLVTIGGDGEGPGEFRALWGVGAYRGDSIYAFDYGLMRTSIFGPDGGFGRLVPNPVPGNYWMGAVFEDGSFFLTDAGGGRFELPQGLHWVSAPVLAVSPDGREVDTLGVFPNQQVLMGSTGVQEARHLGNEALGGPSGSGFFWWASDRDEVRFYDRAGDLRRIVRRERERKPVTEEVKEAYKTGFLDYLGKEQGMDAVAQMAPMLDAAVFAEEVPYFGTVLLDPIGFLWVQDYSTPFFLNRTWSVFDPSGQWLGEVQMPSGLRVTDIGEGYVLGVTMDDVGVQYLQSFRLERGEN
jgi:hypothetical protein